MTRLSTVWSPVYVDVLVARDRNADGNSANGLEERLYALADANYNVTALVSASGGVVERLVSDPYGVASVLDAAGVVKPSGTGYAWVYRHQGGRQSAVSGMLSFRHREYSPTLKRWVQTDPIRFRAGDVNLYRSVGNSPTGRVDPSGLLAIGKIGRLPVRELGKFGARALGCGLLAVKVTTVIVIAAPVIAVGAIVVATSPTAAETVAGWFPEWFGLDESAAAVARAQARRRAQTQPQPEPTEEPSKPKRKTDQEC